MRIVYRVVLWVFLVFPKCSALELSCDSDNVLEVVEGTSNNIVTCTGLDQTKDVEWWRNTTHIGICTPPTNGQDTCTGKSLDPTFVPVRKAPSESVMTISTSNPLDNIEIERKSMKCNIPLQPTVSCDMDLIFPAEGSCLAKFIRRDSTPWGVSIECNISKIYSSIGRYKCEIYSVLSKREAHVFTDNSPTINSAGGKYKTFSSGFTGNMPVLEGLYNYKAIITPGKKIITATSIDSLEILRPLKSTVNCSPSPDVPENTNVTCTCNTTNIGKPGGRLKWYRENNQIAAGIYGNSRLVMSQTLYRNDSGRTQFRCDVEWTTVISGDPFTLSVGYIDQPLVSINSNTNLTVMENATLIFDCRANGKPVPTMSLFNSYNNTQLNTGGQSPMSYKSVSRCEDTATYACIASNEMGNNTISYANLYVNCRPRSRSDIISLSAMTFVDAALEQTFSIIAYPTPDTFSYALTKPMIDQTKVAVVLMCTDIKVYCMSTNVLYVSMCTLTINSITSDASGLYVISIGNTYGHKSFTVEVKVNGSRSCADTETLTFSHGIGVGIGVTITVAVILIAAYVIYHRRQKQKLPCAGNVQETPLTYLTPVLSEMQSDRDAETNFPIETVSTSYDALCKNEVGLSAAYSAFRLYEDVCDVKSDRGDGYRVRKGGDASLVHAIMLSKQIVVQSATDGKIE